MKKNLFLQTKRYFSIKKNIDDNIIDLLIGCLLGDAHIGRSKDNKSFITFEQTIKHVDYINHIYDTLKKVNIDLYDIKNYIRNDSRYNTTNSSVYFKTHNSDIFNFLSDMFLSEGKKNNTFKYKRIFKSYNFSL